MTVDDTPTIDASTPTDTDPDEAATDTDGAAESNGHRALSRRGALATLASIGLVGTTTGAVSATPGKGGENLPKHNHLGQFWEGDPDTDRGLGIKTTGSQSRTVFGTNTVDSGVGVLGHAMGAEGVGLRGMTDAADGYGLHTPDDAKIEGIIDTNETDFTVEAGSTATGNAQNVVQGHASNQVTDSAVGATISGGGLDDGSTVQPNEVYDNFGTVSGGTNNTAGTPDGSPDADRYATVGGGRNNDAGRHGTTVSGGTNNTASVGHATVGGGTDNSAGAPNATVGGGDGNTANGGHATVGGGVVNTASGGLATVPGGVGNIAAGRASSALGARAKAANDDTFVWNDFSSYHDIDGDGDAEGLSSAKDIAGSGITGSDTFHASAQGGFRFITGASSVTYISGGSTGWATTSTRAAKTNIDPVDPQTVLAGVEELAVATWEYTDEDGEGQGIRHIGPMAEDFHDAVDVGDSDEHINSINADGVLFAAVQGLAERVDEKDSRIDTLECENEQLRAEKEQLRERNERLDERLTTLEERVATIDGGQTFPASTDD